MAGAINCIVFEVCVDETVLLQIKIVRLAAAVATGCHAIFFFHSITQLALSVCAVCVGTVESVLIARTRIHNNTT